MWDAPDAGKDRTAEAAYVRVRKAMAECADCKIRDLCQAAAEEEGQQIVIDGDGRSRLRKLTGVWAGEVYYDRLQKFNGKIKEMLEDG